MRSPLLVALVVALPLVAALPAEAAPPAPVVVVAAGFSFAPPVVVVPLSATVEWRGALLPHTVTTSSSLPDAAAGRANDAVNTDGNPDTFSTPLAQGRAFTHTFTKAGVYPYFCGIHYGVGMVGTVVVQ